MCVCVCVFLGAKSDVQIYRGSKGELEVAAAAVKVAAPVIASNFLISTSAGNIGLEDYIKQVFKKSIKPNIKECKKGWKVRSPCTSYHIVNRFNFLIFSPHPLLIHRASFAMNVSSFAMI